MKGLYQKPMTSHCEERSDVAISSVTLEIQEIASRKDARKDHLGTFDTAS